MDKNSLHPVEMMEGNGEWAKEIMLWAVHERSTYFINPDMDNVTPCFGRSSCLEEKNIQAAWTLGARASPSECLSVSQPWPTSLCWSAWILSGCPSSLSTPPLFGSLHQESDLFYWKAKSWTHWDAIRWLFLLFPRSPCYYPCLPFTLAMPYQLNSPHL